VCWAALPALLRLHQRAVMSPCVQGCYDIGLPSRKPLFQLHCERILRLQLLADRHSGAAPGSCRVHVYVLTSAATHAATVAAFSTAANYGLNSSQLFFFQQSSLPCLTRAGDAILQDDGSVRRTRSHACGACMRGGDGAQVQIATAPDGNGGVYQALASSGALRHMRAAGVVCVDCASVDNAAARLGDPMFLGVCSLRGADLGARTVAKAAPEERVGVFARCAAGPCACVCSAWPHRMHRAPRLQAQRQA
jgi:UDP-N-acetylglucosamine/UDP-N-acetylgalactosamine diphosphorylase